MLGRILRALGLTSADESPLEGSIGDTIINLFRHHGVMLGGSGTVAVGMPLFVVVDLETTGLNPNRHRIIEVGAIKICYGKNSHETFGTLVNPGVRIPKKITEITGLDEDKLRDGMTPTFAMRAFHNFVGGLPLIAYNAPFDLSFLTVEMKRANRHIDEWRAALDVLKMARELISGLPNYRLGTVADHFGVKSERAHRALDDCVTTMEVFMRLAVLWARRELELRGN